MILTKKKCGSQEELKFDLNILKRMLNGQELKAENSMGYAEFLNRFQSSENE